MILSGYWGEAQLLRDWCCSDYISRNSLVALLEALCALDNVPASTAHPGLHWQKQRYRHRALSNGKQTLDLTVGGGRQCRLSCSLAYGAGGEGTPPARALAWQRGGGGGWTEERERRDVGRRSCKSISAHIGSRHTVHVGIQQCCTYRIIAARMQWKHACFDTWWSTHATPQTRMHVHVGGFANRANVFAQTWEVTVVFMQICTRNRGRHATRGDYLWITRGIAMQDDICHDDDARVLSEQERRGRLAIRPKAGGLDLAAPTYRWVFLLLPAARGRVP